MAKRTRPRAIVQFEILWIASCLLGLAQALWTLAGLEAASPGSSMISRFGWIELSVISAIDIGLLIGLGLLVSRWRWQLAKWILVVLVLGVTAYGLWVVITRMSFEALAPYLVQMLIRLLAVGLLFTASARAWLNRREPAKLELFD